MTDRDEDDDLMEWMARATMEAALTLTNATLGVLLTAHPIGCPCGQAEPIAAIRRLYGDGPNMSDEQTAQFLRNAADDIERRVLAEGDGR